MNFNKKKWFIQIIFHIYFVRVVLVLFDDIFIFKTLIPVKDVIPFALITRFNVGCITSVNT